MYGTIYCGAMLQNGYVAAKNDSYILVETGRNVNMASAEMGKGKSVSAYKQK